MGAASFPRKLFPVKYLKMNTPFPERAEVTSTYTHPLDNQRSFGYEFNLIKAVEEYAPQRVAEINKRLASIEQETSRLLEERNTLQALIHVVKPVP